MILSDSQKLAIAEAYDAQPVMPSSLSLRQEINPLWKRCGEWFVTVADGIKRLFDDTDIHLHIVDVDEPYRTAIEQSRDILRGRYMVSGNHCDHPIWTEEQNISFRIVHDVFGHHFLGLGFDFGGECEVLSDTLEMIGQPFGKVLLVDSLGQLCASSVSNEFPVQKTFDHRIIEKILND